MAKHPIFQEYLANLKKDQKPNFQEVMYAILNEEYKKEITPSILFHSCCTICAAIGIDLLSKKTKLYIYYYNPNIFPKIEYQRRKIAMEKFVCEYNQNNNTDVIFLEAEYEPLEFYKISKGKEDEKEGGSRCKSCYQFRLDKAAKKCSELKLDYFLTGLTLSPLKNAIILNEVGQQAADKYAVSYLPTDFKKNQGNLKARNICAEYNVYRQNYCGCSYAAKPQNIDFREVITSARKYVEDS